jgi:hypothetical protein
VRSGCRRGCDWLREVAGGEIGVILRQRCDQREELDRSLMDAKLLQTEHGRGIDRARRRMLSKTTSKVAFRFMFTSRST